ncbi:MAG: ABC transporter ATP-binding protein [Blastocatellia bacterium]
MMVRLEADNAGIQLGGRWIVRGATLRLSGGCLLAVIGPNGSGKSTLLRLLGGLWRATEGIVRLDGANLRETSRREIARRIAWTPQDTHLDFAFTVREVVMMGRRPHLGRFQRESARDIAAVDQAMRRADVTELADRLVTELSGGERQRALIARSLATEAPVILLDEPTANLDIAHALDVLALCRDLAREGRAIALAIHDLNLAARFADEVALLGAGRLLAHGAPAGVMRDDLLRDVFGIYPDHARTANGETTLVFHRALKSELNQENKA